MVGGGQCRSVIVVISSLLGDNRGAPSGWRIIHSNNNNNTSVMQRDLNIHLSCLRKLLNTKWQDNL